MEDLQSFLSQERGTDPESEARWTQGWTPWVAFAWFERVQVLGLLLLAVCAGALIGSVFG